MKWDYSRTSQDASRQRKLTPKTWTPSVFHLIAHEFNYLKLNFFFFFFLSSSRPSGRGRVHPGSVGEWRRPSFDSVSAWEVTPLQIHCVSLQSCHFPSTLPSANAMTPDSTFTKRELTAGVTMTPQRSKLNNDAESHTGVLLRMCCLISSLQ